MKKQLLSLFVLILAGAGCMSATANTVEVAGLTFDLPSDWEVVSAEDSLARIAIPDDQYDVVLPFEVEVLDASQTEKLRAGEMGESPEEVASGAMVYQEACAPTNGCVYILHNEVGYLATFLIVESNELPPADLDGVWFPSVDVTREEIAEVFTSVR